jgi:hypothetical protein
MVAVDITVDVRTIPTDDLERIIAETQTVLLILEEKRESDHSNDNDAGFTYTKKLGDLIKIAEEDVAFMLENAGLPQSVLTRRGGNATARLDQIKRASSQLEAVTTSKRPRSGWFDGNTRFIQSIESLIAARLTAVNTMNDRLEAGNETVVAIRERINELVAESQLRSYVKRKRGDGGEPTEHERQLAVIKVELQVALAALKNEGFDKKIAKATQNAVMFKKDWDTAVPGNFITFASINTMHDRYKEELKEAEDLTVEKVAAEAHIATLRARIVDLETKLGGGTKVQRTECALCGAEAELRCTGCKDEHYCSEDCQMADWAEHKLSCC